MVSEDQLEVQPAIPEKTFYNTCDEKYLEAHSLLALVVWNFLHAWPCTSFNLRLQLVRIGKSSDSRDGTQIGYLKSDEHIDWLISNTTAVMYKVDRRRRSAYRMEQLAKHPQI